MPTLFYKVNQRPAAELNVRPITEL